MKYREGKIPPATLAALAILASLCWLAVEHFKVDVRESGYKEKKAAVAAVRKGQESIRAGRKKAGLEINYEHDPAHTGLIGADDQAGSLTTDKGFLRAKQIATQPNLSAVLVAMLKEARIGEGDVVAVGMTGSFPGANLATMCAIEAVGAKPVVICSLGASTWGANQAEFTWLDMEKAAFDAGAIHSRSVAASIGGDKDKGVGMNKAQIEQIRAAILRNGVEKIEEKTLVESINRRMDVYAKAAGGLDRIKCYINVGGGLASIGSNLVGDKMIPNGLSRTYVQKNYPTEGTLLKMLKAGKPVIHLNDFRKLAEDNALPLREAEAGESGEGPIFFARKYNLVLVLSALVGLIATIAAVGLLDLRHALFGRPAPSPAQPKVELPADPAPPAGRGTDPGEPVL
ncbi:MAG: poly-gamma-glutamate system protein [Planctomycetes bacterium]|nr:poly-gamma-glutamate system protein [Planctomycetota bacterium]